MKCPSPVLLRIWTRTSKARVKLNVPYYLSILAVSPPSPGVRKYVLWCLLCGGASGLLGIMFLGVYFLIRYYTSSLTYFETVPTFVPSTLVSFDGSRRVCCEHSPAPLPSTILVSCYQASNFILPLLFVGFEGSEIETHHQQRVI